MAFMRVPSLEEEFGRDAAISLNEMGWGKELLGRALGRDVEGRLVSTTLAAVVPRQTPVFFVFGCMLHISCCGFFSKADVSACAPRGMGEGKARSERLLFVYCVDDPDQLLCDNPPSPVFCF